MTPDRTPTPGPAAGPLAAAPPPADSPAVTDALVEIDGTRLECRLLRPSAAAADAAPQLVFLHEGLGSVALWRDFPARVVAATGLAALVYSRRGYGASDPLGARREPSYMHDEALRTLPAVLARFGIERPILVGHSDGASIALIYAGRHASAPRGVAVLAPHLFVEALTLQSIAAIARGFDAGPLPARMARYHRDPVATFRGWADIWLDPRFAAWNIEAEAAAIRCPVLAIQGEDDEYGTMRQVDRLAELLPQTRLVKLAGCRHSPHLDRPQPVLEALAAWIAETGATR